MRNRKSTQGFTLIELLIVIAIIGILAAVLIPNLLSARNRARDSAAVACASAILRQAEVFQVDRNTYVGFAVSPTGEYGTGPACADTQTGTKSPPTLSANAISGTVLSLGGATVSYSNSAGISSTRPTAPAN